MSKSSLDNFNVGMALSLFGIGALLQSEDGYCKIKELKPGPALRSQKLKENDRIIAVAQGDREPVDVVDMKLSKVVELIRGPKDTEVRLTVVPADAGDLADYMLFTYEVPLPNKIRGSSSFSETFAARGPADTKGRSLRQLDLDRQRVHRPCLFPCNLAFGQAGSHRSIRKSRLVRI
jgi:C-terminal processing protease CtpA/Prc